jgi:hypothetical protein
LGVLTSRAGVGVRPATAELVEVVLNCRILFRKELDVNRRGRLAAAQALQAITTRSRMPPERLGLDSREAIRYLQTEDDLRATVAAVLASGGAGSGPLLQGMAGAQGAGRVHDLAGGLSGSTPSSLLR